MSLACPCGRLDARGRPQALQSCCGRWLESWAGEGPPDAESLMRSRYTAFVLGRADYLLATGHMRTRPRQLLLEQHIKWLGLQVRGHLQTDAEHAQVEFVARQRDSSGRAVRLHELSRFVRAGGRWYYVDGDSR